MSDKSDVKEIEKPVVAKSAVELQRLKLMKLMKNPEKPVLLPERPKSKNVPTVPEFVRNVMGSSAGAGSGEFHVYRHLRRKEYSRQKFIQEKGRKELMDEEYRRKLEENKKLADEVTAKKRAKRLKKRKNKGKRMKKSGEIKNQEEGEKNQEEDESDDTDEEDSSVQNNQEIEKHTADSEREACPETPANSESVKKKEEIGDAR